MLVKPQFEAGKENVGKKGVVKDAAIHFQVLQNVITEIGSLGLIARAVDFSPITGPEGNIEYLLLAVKNGSSVESDLLNTVENAHKYFEKQ